MCGRYTAAIELLKIMKRFNVNIENTGLTFSPRYNIAPNQIAPVIIMQDEKEKFLKLFRWGLIPSWAKDTAIGNQMINARAETIAEKPAFKRVFKKSRCLVVADGFYEWRKEPNQSTKTPFRVVLKSKEPFALAGLWDTWKDPEGKEIRSFTIITTEANEVLHPIHDRMPVIFKRAEEDFWLDSNAKEADLVELLKPYPDEEVEAYPISKLVNSPKNDVPECISPV